MQYTCVLELQFLYVLASYFVVDNAWFLLPTVAPGSTSPAGGFPVIGVIDGKFDSGYLITVTVGTEKLKGVLYQAPSEQPAQPVGVFAKDGTPNAHQHRRRKKSEIRRRDPGHPKPNRSGYNFFFAEQHARLKPLHPGKDREISRMIGDLWNKLKESERTVRIAILCRLCFRNSSHLWY